ncbi:transglutaminase-like domain-containing protein [Flectobacillus major]|jgi:regulator of sirC expression with transglutaminase-like and TPR domain|uniref:transglutaminase-like domain-containing protein n=1 Tax=Flectobacillus major TaxID=103 RepID=UPI00041265B0|nr:transglutaminase-like domain-containing protein [Flectobacillus major]
MELNQSEIKALVSLLDDDDNEVVTLVESRIRSLGGNIIPFLEDRWEESSLSPVIQKKLEDLIHDLQYEAFQKRIMAWYEAGGEDLLEGMWAIATYQYPELSIEKLKQDLEQVYYDIWMEFRDNMHPMDQIKVLNSVIFAKLKFGANTKHFHSASNSMINIVLDSKKGNPISLCVIYMLIAQKLNMPVFGVNLPNLFILTYKSERMQFYINVFNRGLVFSKGDIDNYLSQLNLSPNDIFYQPCTNLDIIRRVLRNLILAFEKVGDDDKVKELEFILNQML